jgi:uncharacterized membrane protein YfcA
MIPVVAFVVAVILVAATAQTLVGFGFALISMPFLVVILDVQDAIVLTSLLSLTNTGIVAQQARRHVPWRTVSWMLAGSLAGMPIGLAVLLLAPEDALRLAVGVSTIVLAAALGTGLRFGSASAGSELGVGFLSGVLNTSTSMNGPPVVLYLQSLRRPPDEFRAALAAFFFIVSALTLAAFVVTGVITAHAVALAGAGLPSVFLGSVIGHALLRRTHPELFRRLVFALLFAAAISAIVSVLVRLG